jgi:hypothetical protein
VNLGDNIPLLHEGKFWSWIRIRVALELVRAKRAQEIFGPKGEFVGIEYGFFGSPEKYGEFRDMDGGLRLPPKEIHGVVFKPPVYARGKKLLMTLPKFW